MQRSTQFRIQSQRYWTKNVGRVKCGSRFESPCDYFLDNLALCQKWTLPESTRLATSPPQNFPLAKLLGKWRWDDEPREMKMTSLKRTLRKQKSTEPSFQSLVIQIAISALVPFIKLLMTSLYKGLLYVLFSTWAVVFRKYNVNVTNGLWNVLTRTFVFFNNLK